MNIFLIENSNDLSRVRRNAEKIHSFISVTDAEGSVCISSGYEEVLFPAAECIRDTVSGAELIRSHLLSADKEDFLEICNSCELFSERILCGSLAEYGTLIIVSKETVIRAFLQSALHLEPTEALSLSLKSEGVRYLETAGNHFFDLGYLPDEEASLSSGTSTPASFGGLEKEEAQEEEQFKKVIINYYSTHFYTRDTMKLIDNLNRKVNAITQMLTEGKTLWGMGMPGGYDYARQNELLLFCKMLDIVRDRLNARMLDNSFGLEPENSLNQYNEQAYDEGLSESYGILPEPKERGEISRGQEKSK